MPRPLALFLLFTLTSPGWVAAAPASDAPSPPRAELGGPDPVGGLFRMGGAGGTSGIRFEIGGGVVDSAGFVDVTWEVGTAVGLYAYQMVSVDGGAVLPTRERNVAPFIGGRIGVGGGFGFLGFPALVRPSFQLGFIVRAPENRHGLRVALDAGVISSFRVIVADPGFLGVFPAVQLQLAWIVGAGRSPAREATVSTEEVPER